METMNHTRSGRTCLSDWRRPMPIRGGLHTARTLRRDSAIMPTVWSDLEHVSRCTRTEHFVFGVHVIAGTNTPRRTRMTLLPRVTPAHTKRHNLQCARLIRSVESAEMGYAAGGLAPEMAEDGDLAGRAELPGFGSADSPSPKRLQTVPRQFSPVPDSCRSGNSPRRRNYAECPAATEAACWRASPLLSQPHPPKCPAW